MIGLFDSGSGGLTVLRALRNVAPDADIVYFGDIKNAPYGTRSAEELAELTRRSVALLRERGATELVSACNSVSMSVLAGASSLRQGYGHAKQDSMPFVEMSLPTAEYLQTLTASARRHLNTTPQLSRSHLSDVARYLLIATPATIESQLYEKAVAEAVELDPLPIADLAGAIEFDESEQVIESVLDDAFSSRSGNAYDGLILGCTHYPLVRHIIERVAFEQFGELEIIDPAVPVAEAAVKKFDIAGEGRMEFLVSRESVPFEEKVEMLFDDANYTIEVV